MDAGQVVREFCAAWDRRDIDELLGYFTADAVYHNIPIDAAAGHDAIRAVLQMFVPMASAITFDIHHLAVNGDVVLTERTDRFTINGQEIALRVMGTFEVAADGKIRAWRDYFDMQQWVSQMA